MDEDRTQYEDDKEREYILRHLALNKVRGFDVRIPRRLKNDILNLCHKTGMSYTEATERAYKLLLKSEAKNAKETR